MATMQIMDTRQANNQFGALLNVIQEGNTIALTRENREVAVILSPRDFELLGGEEMLNRLREEYIQKNREELQQAFEAMREEAQKNGLTQEILDDIMGNLSLFQGGEKLSFSSHKKER